MRIRKFENKLLPAKMITEKLSEGKYESKSLMRVINEPYNYPYESLLDWLKFIHQKYIIADIRAFDQGLYLIKNLKGQWLVVPKDEENIIGFCTGRVNRYIEWIEIAEFDYRDPLFSTDYGLSLLSDEAFKRFNTPKELPEFKIRRASATANRADKPIEELKEWDRIAEVIKAEKAKFAKSSPFHKSSHLSE